MIGLFGPPAEWTPTCIFRFARYHEDGFWKETKLEQKWIRKGEEEWRAIPIEDFIEEFLP